MPEILIKNTTIYGILSKGIYELSEEDRRKYFSVVKECIYQILGMWESIKKAGSFKQSAVCNIFID